MVVMVGWAATVDVGALSFTGSRVKTREPPSVPTGMGVWKVSAVQAVSPINVKIKNRGENFFKVVNPFSEDIRITDQKVPALSMIRRGYE
jgi:hypothetical protein